MTILSILETILIGPLKLVFEIIFDIANRVIGHPGLAIIVLSLCMNVLVLPLYRRADAMQEQARDIEAKLQDGINHIKKTFSGDERMMVLQTYYRQNHYSPLSALNGSVSLLLEIPFFMAAYQFLSHAAGFDGVSFGPIADLSAPDGLIVIGGVAINLLPILMTVINVISSSIYLKGFPLKSKIQLYAMAMFFLVFLYRSPSCLVFYWTLNNLFSFAKNIFYKLKNPRKVLVRMLLLLGIPVMIFGAFFYETISLKRKLFVIGLGALMAVPMLFSLIGNRVSVRNIRLSGEPNRKQYTLACVFLAVLTGVLIPSAFLAASPQEFVDVSHFHHPLWYIVSSASYGIGFFLVWMQVFYWIANEQGKLVLDKIVWILCAVMLVNYMFFGTDLGIISSVLQYENLVRFSFSEQIMNLAVLAVVSVVMYFAAVRFSKNITMVLLTAAIAVTGMSAVNIFTVQKSIDAMYIPAQEQMGQNAEFRFSKNGKNVVVLMLDRAIGAYVPYIFAEKPELQEQFDGFTYYSNTISYGMATNFGAPALFGGYEYTPVEMNARDDVSLKDKHNEALKVMPAIFAENDYEVTVCDPVYANYQWIPDLTIYDEYPEINTYITDVDMESIAGVKMAIENNRRNFFCLALMKTLPLAVQPTLYDNGQYNQVVVASVEGGGVYQEATSLTTATGLTTAFTRPYGVLNRLSEMSKITDEPINTYLMMTNNTTHQPVLLQEPDYIPAEIVDNTEYAASYKERYTVNGVTLATDDVTQVKHYHVNMAAMLQIGNWLDYLRENGVYDNTRIIIVSDHGYLIRQIQSLLMNDGAGGTIDTELYFPLLLVKDFNESGFKTSEEFMTNADVPVMAMDELIDQPRNPFTGKLITDKEKYAHDQFIIMSTEWEVDKHTDNHYLPAEWASVKDNRWDAANWNFYVGNEIVLTDHKLP